MEPTTADASALWSWAPSLGCKVAHKRDLPERDRVAAVVEAATGQPPAVFLARYATTLVLPGDSIPTIWIPFHPGEESQEWTPRAQVKIAAHELQHVAQWQRFGAAWLALWAASSSSRARWEAEARSAAQSAAYSLWGEEPGGGADQLGVYGCSLADVEAERRTIALDADVIRSGAITHQGAAWVVGWARSR